MGSGGSISDSYVLGSCRVCGWATLPGSKLCIGCLDIREWSRVNRAFCNLLHRPKDPGLNLWFEADRSVYEEGFTLVS